MPKRIKINVLILMWKAYCQTVYLILTGIDRDSFDDLCGHVKEVRETKVRPIRPCIGILLTKLRSGMSNVLLSTMFNKMLLQRKGIYQLQEMH